MHPSIPFVDLKAQYLSIKQEIDQTIQQVLSESAFIGGKYVNEFEQAFASMLDASHCVGVGNGTDAIFIALKSLGIGPGDEVIVQVNSIIATSEAVTMTGAKVVFADIRADSFHIDPNQILKKISSKTKAIIPVHLYGNPVEMDPVLDIARKHHLFVIEDAAQAHLAEYKGRKVGTLGDAACFSFYPGKNLGAYGDAGAIVTNNEQIATQSRMFANHGRIAKYDHEFEGINSRLDSLQAAILTVKLNHLASWIQQRQNIAQKYDQGLKDVSGCITPVITKDGKHVYHLYVVRMNERERLRQFLTSKGINTGIHYPTILPALPAYRYLNHQAHDFPVGSQLQHEILSLPVYPEMTEEQIEYIINQIHQFAHV
ncbi:MAG: DegT/DnrJ/EryC1/StrS family aminotransferase [SAR324 cluster bacterium]|nr:DegT/DnrJ/EryC1/StrS family aminotransferase [SAR324 cluster bacterium]